MKLVIPNSAFLGNIDPFLRNFNPEHIDLLEIEANKKWVSVHPLVLTMIAALGLKAKKIKCNKITAKSGHYLERMGMFSFLGLKSGMKILEHDPSGRFIPLVRIKGSTDLAKFISEMIPLLHLEQKQSNIIGHIISELVRNVLEHAQTKEGAIVAAQYHKKSNTIRIGISDIGIGIRSSINQSYKTGDDLEAIQLALTPGITGTTTREGGTAFNAGAGLFFIKSIANVNRNFFVIYSGTAMFKLLKRKENKKEIKLYADPFLDRHTKIKTLPKWEGTVVGIDISLDNTSEFTQLLDLIWPVYKQAIKERKKLKYKKPRFI
jgi:anti-sigma regulatory factor (Ser/Thr protein kinase)